MATVGLAAHVFFELAAGVGMPLASVIGPAAAAGTWSAATTAVLRTAGRRPASSDVWYGLLNTAGLAAVIAHLTGWPRRRTRLGLPWLRECEGLGPELMSAYNPILYISGAAALAALVTENRGAPRRIALLVAPLMPIFRAAQHAEHRRLVDHARCQPGWWNRRLQRMPDPRQAS